MKILLLTQNLNNDELAILRQGVAQVKTFLPQLDFFYETTNAQFNSIPFSNDVAFGYLLDNTQILPLVSGDFSIACLVYDWDFITPRPTNPSTSWIKKGDCIPMAIPKQWYGSPVGFPEVFCEFFIHELSHAEAFRSGKPDLTHSKYSPIWNGKFNQLSNVNYYMFLLKDYMAIKPPIIPPVLPTPTTYQTLRLKSKNNVVKILQTKLNTIIGSTLLVDGDFGKKTLAVVIEFQKKYNLAADGIVGKRTWQAFEMIEVITKVCNNNGVEPLVGVSVASCESSLNPKATLFNQKSNSTDRGLFQWNSKYHPEITDEVAFDPAQATKLFCDAVKKGKLHAYWSASEPCWSKKLSADLLAKYNIV